MLNLKRPNSTDKKQSVKQFPQATTCTVVQSSCKTSPYPRPGSPTSQAGQLGDTTGNITAFLRHHRPSSPSSRSRPSTPTQPDVKQQQKTTSKVEDVLQHFAQHGLNATPKLYHVVPAPAAGTESATSSRSSSSASHWNACPYELQVVTKSNLPASYGTVAAAGVVHVPGNAEPCTYTSIGMWLRNRSMFKVLRALRAFKQVWQGYTISRWHANVRQLVFQRNRQQLAQRLLILKLPYLKLLMDCRSKMGAVLAAGALQPMPAGLYKLETLVEQQQEYQLSKLAPLIVRTISAIVIEVEHMASRLQSSEQLLRRELKQYEKDPSAGAAQGLNSIKIRAERTAVADKHATALYDLQRLPAFLRLLGIHVLQTYLDLLISAVSGLKQHLETTGNFLVADIVLTQGGVALSPTMEELLRGLSKGIIEHLVGVLKAAPRPLKHPSLVALLEDPVKSSSIVSHNIAARARSTSGSGGTGCTAAEQNDALICTLTDAARRITNNNPSGYAGTVDALAQAGLVMVNGIAMPIGAPAVSLPSWLADRDDDDQGAEGGQLLLMMVGDHNLATLRRGMDQQVMRSYREASQVADTLAELSVLLRFVHMWDAAAYKAKEHTVGQLRKDTLLLKEWQARLQVICDAQHVGLLQLQTGFLKTTYMTKLASAQATIAMMLVSAARKECQTATAQLLNLAKELVPQPSKLPEFIAFRLRVKEIWNARDRLIGLHPSQVKDMYATATAWGGRLPHTDQVLLDDMQEAVRSFNRAMTAANAFLDSRQAGMLSILDRQAKDILKRVQATLKQLEAVAMAQRIGTPAATAAAAGLTVSTERIAAWQQQLKDFAAATVAINNQEGQMGVKLTYYADIEEAGRVLKEIQEANDSAATA